MEVKKRREMEVIQNRREREKEKVKKEFEVETAVKTRWKCFNDVSSPASQRCFLCKLIITTTTIIIIL